MEKELKRIQGYETYLVSNTGNVYNTRFNKIKELVATNQYGYSYVDLSKNNVTARKAIHRLVAEAFIPNPENKPVVNHIDSNRKNNSVENLEWCTYQENSAHAILHGFVGTDAGGSNNAILTKSKVQEILEVYKRTRSQSETSKRTGICRGTISAICSGKYYIKLEDEIKMEFSNIAESNSTKRKKVQQIDMSNNVVKEFNSIGDAHRETEINRAHISSTCSGKRKTAGGFKWKYKI